MFFLVLSFLWGVGFLGSLLGSAFLGLDILCFLLVGLWGVLWVFFGGLESLDWVWGFESQSIVAILFWLGLVVFFFRWLFCFGVRWLGGLVAFFCGGSFVWVGFDYDFFMADLNRAASFVRDIYDNYREWHMEDEEEWYKEYMSRIFMHGNWELGEKKKMSVGYVDFFDESGNYVDFFDESWDYLWSEYGFEWLSDFFSSFLWAVFFGMGGSEDSWLEDWGFEEVLSDSVFSSFLQ